MTSFRDQIQAHAGAGGYVSRAQERSLLRLGTAGYGLEFDHARGALLEAAAADRLVLESAVDDAVADYLATRAGASGRVSRSAFQSAVDLYRSHSRGLVGPEQAAGRVKDVMLRRGFAPRPAGLLWRTRGWFERIPRPAEAVAADVALPVAQAGIQAPVQATLDAWAAAFNAGDVPGVLALYAPNALLLATAVGEPMTDRGSKQIYFENLMVAQSASVRFDATLDIDGTDPATASGLYTFSWNGAGGGRVSTAARFSYVVTRDGAGPIGRILQHHSSAVPQRTLGANPV